MIGLMALPALVPLLGYILTWRRLTGSQSSASALHASSAMLLALYLGAITGLLLPVTALLLAGGTVLAIVELRLLIIRREALPLPVGVLLVLCTLFTLLHYDATLYLYDEFAHWGIYLKELLANDAVWGKDSNAMVLRYPPGAPLWQYLFLRFTVATEASAYVGQFCLLMIPLLVLWQDLKWRQIYWLLAILALLAITLSNFGHGFSSLYVDHLLGAWFAGTIFNFMKELETRSPRGLLTYALPVTTLVLIKDAGLFFAAAAIGTMALLLFWRFAFVAERKHPGAGFAKAGPLVLICLLTSGFVAVSWNANRDAAGIPPSVYSARGIVSGITSGDSELSAAEQVELRRRFMHVVLYQQLSKNQVFTEHGEFNYEIMPIFTDSFRLTTSSLLLLFSLWLIVMSRFALEQGQRWRWVVTGTALGLTAVAYVVILYLSYHYAFGERRMILPSYLRYVHTAVLPLVLFVFLPFIPAFSKDRQPRLTLTGNLSIGRPAAVFGIILGAFFIIERPHLSPLYIEHASPAMRQQMKPYIDQVRRQVEGESTMWIYLPIPDPNGQRNRMFLYDMAPVHTEIEFDPEFWNDDPDALEKIVADWDYLWFPIKNEKAEAILRSVAGDDLKDHVFRVERRNGKVNVIALDGVF